MAMATLQYSTTSARACRPGGRLVSRYSARYEVLREGDAYVLRHALRQLPRNVAPGTVGGIDGRRTRKRSVRV